jgi:hypothetical protein
LLKYDETILSPLILKPIGIKKENLNQNLYFDKDYTLEQIMEYSNYVIDGQPTPHSLKRLRWQLVDGNMLYGHVKMQKRKWIEIEITQPIYDSK